MFCKLGREVLEVFWLKVTVNYIGLCVQTDFKYRLTSLWFSFCYSYSTLMFDTMILVQCIYTFLNNLAYDPKWVSQRVICVWNLCPFASPSSCGIILKHSQVPAILLKPYHSASCPPEWKQQQQWNTSVPLAKAIWFLALWSSKSFVSVGTLFHHLPSFSCVFNKSCLSDHV